MACLVSGISLSSTVAISDVHSAGLGTACARKTRCTVPGWPLYIGAIAFKLYSYNLYSLLQRYFPSLPLGFVRNKLFYLKVFVPELSSSSVLSCSLASLMVRVWMGEDSHTLDISWRADAKPVRLLRGDLVSPLPSSSVFVVLSDLGFWVCGDDVLWRFGSPLYDSLCLQASCCMQRSHHRP